MNHAIEVCMTARESGDRLSWKTPIELTKDSEGVENNVVNVYDELSYQEIIGFGSSIT